MSKEEVQETEELENNEEVEPVSGNTNDAINAPLDEVDDPATLKKMVKKLRGEAAKHRTEKKSTESELVEFRKWKESQMSELEKANARAEAAEQRAADALKRSAAREFGLISEDDEELLEYIKGSTEDEIRESAEKLSKRFAKQPKEDVLPGGNSPLRPGKRGTPVGGNSALTDGAKFIAEMFGRP